MATLKGRLWGGESSSEDSSSSDSEEEQTQTQAADNKAKTRVVWAEESSSDDEAVTKRKVVSHADKRYDQMKTVVQQLKNHQKVNDFAEITSDYESLLKMIEKHKNAIEQEGGPPNFFVKACAVLEDYCQKQHEEHLEAKANKGTRLPENKAKAFNTLRAKVRKGNKTWQDLIDKCKEDPSAFEDAANEDSDDDGSSDSSSGSGSGSGSSDSDSSSSGSGSGSDSDSSSGSNSDSDSSSDSDSDSSDSQENSYKSGTDDSSDDDDEDAAREKKMLRWLITPEQQKKRDDKEAKKQQVTDKQKDKKPREKNPKSGQQALDKEAGKKEKQEYTPEELKNKIQEVLQMRGRRGFSRKEYMDKLENLTEHAEKQGPRAQLFILTAMISADFDNTGGVLEAMKISLWIEAYEKVCRMLPLMVESQKNFENPETDPEAGEGHAADEEDPRSHLRLQDLFVSFVEKLDDELYKALQLAVDVYGTEYQDILVNSSKFLILIKRVRKFFEDTVQVHPLGLMSLRLMEQLYYNPDSLNKAVFDSIRHQVPEAEKDDWIWPEDSKKYMRQLCSNVFPNGKPLRPRTAEATEDGEGAVQPRLHRRASLCQAYHMALHDDFESARDLLNLGNLHENAMNEDVHTQILYNRVLAQMGLCGFRLGKIQEAHYFLMDICMHNKARELLAQGLSYARNVDRTPEQERTEKMRQMPYHMHINLEVLESAHRICAMLLEVPNLAMQSIDPTNRKQISRVLRRALEDYEKRVFTGPPEDAKESVTYSAKALQRGDWQCAVESLEELKLWAHIDSGGNAEAGEKVKAMIKEKIQTEALRTYLFTYASIYDAFHLDQLVAMFGLEAKLVHSIVSKMMIKEEITAFWDETSKYVLMQHSEPTPLQRLALQLADRGAQAVENNEKMVDNKSGGYGLTNREKGAQQQGRWDQGAAGSGKGRFGKGGAPERDAKGFKGKGRGKSSFGSSRPATNRGWENARTLQRGWSTGTGTRS